MKPTDPTLQPLESKTLTTESPEEKNWALVSHLSGFAGYLVPFGNIIAPLLIWKMKEAKLPFASSQALEALNFQISFTIYAFVAGLSIFILIGLILLPLVVIAGIVFTVIGAINASEGKAYRYPFNLRLIN